LDTLIHLDIKTGERLQWQADQVGQPLETYISTILRDHAAEQKTMGPDEAVFNSPVNIDHDIVVPSALVRLLQIVSSLPSAD